MNGAEVPAVNILAHDPTIFPRVKKEPSFAMNAFKFARNNEVCDSLVQFLVKIGKTRLIIKYVERLSEPI